VLSNLMALLAAFATLQAAPEDLHQLAMDELIERLPSVGCDGTSDERGRFTLDPVVAELRSRLEQGVRLTDAQWQRALLVSKVFRFRETWPAGISFDLSVHEPLWTSTSADPAIGTRIRAILKDPELKAVEAGILYPSECGLAAGLRALPAEEGIGPLSPGHHRILFDVFVESGVPDEPRGFARSASARLGSPARAPTPPLLMWSGPVAIEVDVVPSLKDVMPAVDSHELRDLVRRSIFRLGPLSKENESSFPVLVFFDAGGNDVSVLAETAFSLTVELIRKDASSGVRWMMVGQAGGFRPCPDPKHPWRAGPVELPPIPDGTSLEDVAIRVRGVPKQVVRHQGARAWWNGTVTVPLADLPVRR
jgi:hypothetical protein